MTTNLLHSTTGVIHLASALAAMLLGGAVILLSKGTTIHKRVGYVYVAAMVSVNVTAFMIYRLFGTYGPFHIAAIISSVGIIGGMAPVLLRQHVPDWKSYHYYFMNWSVVGLYAAFWAESLVRLFPMQQFWPVVALATGLTTGLGSYLINRNKARFLGPISKERLLTNSSLE
ncbi:DUF2306 domain-containing protein [Spirosoma utsteinense]|uniref:DUF2306 domain-containing protein n=1 Tax=Spirosoma utsteinense TaxID=2585773 RepID=UPI00164613CB|nr:DUF2306 domain-containing protein [Spirosoma utsteinense]MBC3783943.1 putative membrane protein [Spirosoma utsteinense]